MNIEAVKHTALIIDCGDEKEALTPKEGIPLPQERAGMGVNRRSFVPTIPKDLKNKGKSISAIKKEVRLRCLYARLPPKKKTGLTIPSRIEEVKVKFL